LSGKTYTVAITALSTFILTTLWYNTLGPFSFQENAPASKVEEITKLIDKTYIGEVDYEKLSDYSAYGLVAALGDPYSEYYDKQQAKEAFSQIVEGTYLGIGVEVYVDKDTNLITVLAPREGGPADRAGIIAGDVIYAIDGTQYDGSNYKEAVNYMKGIGVENAQSTPLTLIIKRGGEFLTFTLKRETLDLLPVKYTKYDDIGYIRIPGFDYKTADQFENIIKGLGDDIKGLVIDLRNNPGGSYDAAVKIADMLLPEGTIVYAEDKQGNKKYEQSDKSAIDLPFAVLINQNSASAAEILAGAIKDHKAGVLIGEKTFGKGIVQTVRMLSDKSAVKLTTQKYYTPNGTSIHGVGIEPDVYISLGDEYKNVPISKLSLNEDTQLYKAISMLRNGEVKRVFK